MGIVACVLALVTWQTTQVGPWPKDIVVSFLPQESTTNGVNRLKMSFHNQSADGPAAMVYFAPLAATPVRDMDVTLQAVFRQKTDDLDAPFFVPATGLAMTPVSVQPGRTKEVVIDEPIHDRDWKLFVSLQRERPISALIWRKFPNLMTTLTRGGSGPTPRYPNVTNSPTFHAGRIVETALSPTP